MFTVYTKDNCQFCDMAKGLLEQKGKNYETKKLGKDISREELLSLVPTARTMPQIFKDGGLVGGYTELKQLLAA